MKFYIKWFFIIFWGIKLFVSSLSAIPNKPVSDVETVCNAVVETSRMWGSKPLSFQPKCVEKLRGIGPKVISTAILSVEYSDLNKTTCYDNLIPTFCDIQFEKYEASPGCRDTAQTFFDIIMTCAQSADEYAAHCPTVDVTDTKLIYDPKLFCLEANLKEFKAENPVTGLPESLSFKKFHLREQQDCQNIAMVYNSCVQLGVKYLGYPYKYCVSNSFAAYCRKSRHIIDDAQFRLICENVVVPTFAEYYIQHHRHVNAEFCSSLYQRYLTYLAAKKGAAYKNVKKMAYNLELSGKPLVVINRIKGPLLMSKAMDIEYINVWKKPVEYLSQINAVTVKSIPSFICREFDILENAARETSWFSYSIGLPESTSLEHVLEGARNTNAQIEKLVALQKKVVLSAKRLTALLEQYLNNSLPPQYSITFFESIANTRLAYLEQNITSTVQYMEQVRERYNNILNIWPIKAMAKDQANPCTKKCIITRSPNQATH